MSKVKKLLCTSILFALSAFALQSFIYGQEPKFRQTDDLLGLVSMEAENYSNMKVSTVGTSWDFVTEPESYSGSGAMQAQPGGEERHKTLADAQAEAPVLEYTVNFVFTEPLYVWARASHLDGLDDSVWFGLDGQIIGDLPLSYYDANTAPGVWYWISELMYHAGTRDKAILNIPTEGVHTFELYMREGNFRVDKIVLTMDELYVADFEYAEGESETLYDTAVEIPEGEVPQGYLLSQNYPNPFNPTTKISYRVPRKSQVIISIYNSNGELVEHILNQEVQAGVHEVMWDASNRAAGIYFIHLDAGSFNQTNKCLLLK